MCTISASNLPCLEEARSDIYSTEVAAHISGVASKVEHFAKNTSDEANPRLYEKRLIWPIDRDTMVKNTDIHQTDGYETLMN